MNRSIFHPLLLLLVAAACDASRPTAPQRPADAIAASAASFARGPARTTRGATRTSICHKPGTPAEQTLTVADAALPAHLGHGDRLGACGLPPGAVACPGARIATGAEGPQATLIFQDTGPSLLYLSVVQSLSTNANVAIPTFDPATADPITVTATRIDPAQPATFVIAVRKDTESTSSIMHCSYQL